MFGNVICNLEDVNFAFYVPETRYSEGTNLHGCLFLCKRLATSRSSLKMWGDKGESNNDMLKKIVKKLWEDEHALSLHLRY